MDESILVYEVAQIAIRSGNPRELDRAIEVMENFYKQEFCIYQRLTQIESETPNSIIEFHTANKREQLSILEQSLETLEKLKENLDAYVQKFLLQPEQDNQNKPEEDKK
ncbi:hypothetical protein J4225_03480 [Candidatus Pacearchaeota archaeon]|nr:hypothetical protein [Candidatus Pacearchaeota archaeon]